MIRDIDHEQLVSRLEEMIEVLEYDSMRSAGKAKLNSQHLHSMYWLLQNVYKVKPTTRGKEKK